MEFSIIITMNEINIFYLVKYKRINKYILIINLYTIHEIIKNNLPN